MKRLPRSIVSLIIYLLVLFNLERIPQQDTQVIDIKGFVYILIVILIISIIQIETVRNISLPYLLIGSTILYVIGKFIVFYYWTAWDNGQVYLIITELSLIWLAVILARMIGTYLGDFKKAVESITFSGLEKAKNLNDAREEIQTEFYRSRRYNYPLTLVVVQPDTNPLEYNQNIAIKEIQTSMLGRYAAVRLAKELSKNLRLLDTIIDLGKDTSIAILYPQTDGDKADYLINRINSSAHDMGFSVACGHASFPSDALTFDELLRVASDNVKFPFTDQINKDKDSDNKFYNQYE